MVLIQIAETINETLSAYCFGRVLAERFGMACRFPQLRGLVLDWQTDGTEYLGSETVWSGHWPFDSFTGRKLLPDELFRSPQSLLRLAGKFHRYELFLEKEDEIRESWLAPSDPIQSQPERSLAVALTTIPTDQDEDEKSCLTATEIRQLVRTLKPSDLVLIAAQADHPYFSELADLAPRTLIRTGWAQVLTIRSFNRIAISQDAGHWWGAFLSDAEEVYFPPLAGGPWTHPEPAILSHDPDWHGIDLRIKNDSRFIYDWYDAI